MARPRTPSRSPRAPLIERLPWWMHLFLALGLYLITSQLAKATGSAPGGAFETGTAPLSAYLHYGSWITPLPFLVLALIQWLNRDQAFRRNEPGTTEGALKSTPADGRNLSEQLMGVAGAYQATPGLLTVAELRAYRLLALRYEGQYLICPKVRVVDVITPNTERHAKDSKEFLSLFRQLSQWHLDFVLVDPETFQVVCALELDDRTHARPDRRKRDRILNAAFANAGAPLQRIAFRNGQLAGLPETFVAH